MSRRIISSILQENGASGSLTNIGYFGRSLTGHNSFYEYEGVQNLFKTSGFGSPSFSLAQLAVVQTSRGVESQEFGESTSIYPGIVTGATGTDIYLIFGTSTALKVGPLEG